MILCVCVSFWSLQLVHEEPCLLFFLRSFLGFLVFSLFVSWGWNGVEREGGGILPFWRSYGRHFFVFVFMDV